jgi:16S rRNA (cytosine967-C5)-methyltransferase
MTPGARVAAAIAVLDQINAGAAAEQALTAWARGSRFAGSKDRAAVRDHVFDVLRTKRSLGDGAGRSLMLRLARREGWDIPFLFSGDGHAPAQLTSAESSHLDTVLDLTDAARCDIPDWLWPLWQTSMGDQAAAAAIAQQGRADVFLRVNRRRGTVANAIAQLERDGVIAVEHPHVTGCLRVVEHPRRVKMSSAYLDGVVELQDAASQDAIARTPVNANARVLDYCAGGGGKALAIADQYKAAVFAHDIAPQRMRDLPQRAKRAGVDVALLKTQDLPAQGKFDVVFCDAPCSGSGTWRRTPDAKWRMSDGQLKQLIQTQAEVLDRAAALVAEEGVLVYATCSILKVENDAALAGFCQRQEGWQVEQKWQRLPDQDGDGFFLSILSHFQYN